MGNFFADHGFEKVSKNHYRKDGTMYKRYEISEGTYESVIMHQTKLIHNFNSYYVSTKGKYYQLIPMTRKETI